jgi:hypothetical protein
VIVLGSAALLLSAEPAHSQSTHQLANQSYTNTRYRYTLSYRGTLTGDHTDPSLDILSIIIDPKAEPIHVCAADNLGQWTSAQLFEEWKRKAPSSRFDEFPCGDYPSYARLATSTITIGGRGAYQVVSFRGPFETVCSYLATAKTLLGICLPPENPAKAPSWPTHLNEFNDILASVKILE